jgi:SSS family transporter
MALLAQAHVEFPDYVMLVGYFVLMLGIGAYFYRYMRGMKDYFSGGNTIPWWLSGASFFMSSFSVFAFVSFSALAYQYGWVAVTLYWVTVPATIFSVVLFAKKWRRARIDSPVEYLETRYSFGLRQLFTWQGLPVLMVDDALKLIAIGSFIAGCLSLPEIPALAALGLEEPVRYTMVASALIMLLYTLMGGLWAVAVTDFIQFVVMGVAVLVVLPLSIQKAGGLEFVFDRERLQFVNVEYNWVYVVLLASLYCLAWSSVKWPLIQRYYCVRDEKEAAKVGWFVVVLNVIGPPLMFLPAMAATQFLGDLADDKLVYPRLCALLLPAGMLGLVVAAMFSATMSMLSSDYNACAGVLTNDVYRRLFRKDASQKELVLVGRLMTLLVGAFALAVALGFGGTSGEDLFRYMVTLFGIATAPVAVPMILGLLSKRVTNAGAIVGFLAGLAVGLGLFFLFHFALPAKTESALVCGITWNPVKEEVVFPATAWYAETPLKKEVFLFTANALVTLIAMLVVSCIKPMNAAERGRVDAFHDRLRVPIGALEEDRLSPDTKLLSPFFIVGISVVLIGVLMLAVQPWVTGGLAFGLNLGLAAVLIAIGGLMTWYSRRGSET